VTSSPSLLPCRLTLIQDVVVSSDGQFALSGSWDGTLRLWDLTTGNSTRTFVGASAARCRRTRAPRPGSLTLPQATRPTCCP